MAILSSKKNQSIDLLKENESVKSSQNKISILIFFSVLILLQFLVFSVFLFLNFNTKSQLNKLNDEVLAQSQTQAGLSSTSAILQSIKAKLNAYTQLSSKYGNLDGMVQKVSALIPENVTLVSFGITSAGKVTLEASSDSPNAAYQFYNTLFTDKSISDLNLTTLTKVADKYHFNITFTVKAQ